MGEYSKIGYIGAMASTARARREQRLTTEAQLAALLRERRKAKGFSQQQVAGKLGVTQARLSELESGRAHITLERLIALVQVLDLEVILRDRTTQAAAAEW